MNTLETTRSLKKNKWLWLLRFNTHKLCNVLLNLYSLKVYKTWKHQDTKTRNCGQVLLVPHSCSFSLVLFTAEFLGLPLVPPFYGSQIANFDKGVNFAVGGATALEQSFLEDRGIHFPYTNVSLGVQLKSFKESLPKLYGSSSGGERLNLFSCFLFYI